MECKVHQWVDTPVTTVMVVYMVHYQSGRSRVVLNRPPLDLCNPRRAMVRRGYREGDRRQGEDLTDWETTTAGEIKARCLRNGWRENNLTLI